jgi:hypothetical protein
MAMALPMLVTSGSNIEIYKNIDGNSYPCVVLGIALHLDTKASSHIDLPASCLPTTLLLLPRGWGCCASVWSLSITFLSDVDDADKLTNPPNLKLTYGFVRQCRWMIHPSATYTVRTVTWALGDPGSVAKKTPMALHL